MTAMEECRWEHEEQDYLAVYTHSPALADKCFAMLGTMQAIPLWGDEYLVIGLEQRGDGTTKIKLTPARRRAVLVQAEGKPKADTRE